MNFSAITFLYYFLPLVVAGYFLCRGRHARNAVLLAASLFFYAWGEGVFLVLLLGSIGANHVFAQRIERAEGAVKKRFLALAVTANLLFLLLFKYTGLITETLSPLGIPRIETHLPLGISFFTFQAISMIVDVYRGAKPSSSMMKTGLYISMFPQLVAGPIVRFNEIRAQIDKREETFDRFAEGVKLFIIGLSQKVLIADTLSKQADLTFGAVPAELGMGAAWFGLFCFSLQIYYDFSGYSNMAIGLGRLFGFELPKNFSHPYSASSFQEFWRRWHMTLSCWFRDYLYIPLGGSRGSALATYRNLVIVFVLCGLWHGAAWTFLFWGLWHGAFLIAERLCPTLPGPNVVKKPLGMLYVFLFVSLGWVLFRADNMTHAMEYGYALAGLNPDDGVRAFGINQSVIIAFLFGLLFAWDGTETFWERTKEKLASAPALVRGFALPALVWGMPVMLYGLCFVFMASETHKPFLYFRF